MMLNLLSASKERVYAKTSRHDISFLIDNDAGAPHLAWGIFRALINVTRYNSGGLPYSKSLQTMILPI